MTLELYKFTYTKKIKLLKNKLIMYYIFKCYAYIYI